MLRFKYIETTLLFVGVVVILLAGCASPTATLTPLPPTPTSPPPTATVILPTATSTPTETPQPTQTPLPTATKALPTATLTIVAPSDTPTATATNLPTLAATQAGAALPSASRDAVWIYFIQPGTGGPICGDTAVAVGSGVTRSGSIADDTSAALKSLFAYQTEYVGSLYNPLWRSNLRVNNVSFNDGNGLITVDLSGTYKPSGDDCDNTRVKAQIWGTIRQWRGVKATNIYLNGIPFGDRLSNDK